MAFLFKFMSERQSSGRSRKPLTSSDSLRRERGSWGRKEEIWRTTEEIWRTTNEIHYRHINIVFANDNINALNTQIEEQRERSDLYKKSSSSEQQEPSMKRTKLEELASAFPSPSEMAKPTTWPSYLWDHPELICLRNKVCTSEKTLLPMTLCNRIFAEFLVWHYFDTIFNTIFAWFWHLIIS